MTPNQRAVIKKRGPQAQAFPGDVDTLTTQSVSKASSVKYRSLPEPPAAPVRSAQINETGETLESFIDSSRTKIKNSLPSKTAVATPPPVLQPQQKNNPALKLVGIDAVSTGSIPATKPAAARATPEKTGWTRTGGTWVTVRNGETLNNLSRRYGVPVMAIMNANGLKDASSVATGSRVIIPTYNFGSTAPVSAPDANPVTKASRSSRGFEGQAAPNRITLPKRRVGLQKSQAKSEKATIRPTTSTGTYMVTTGDTLYGIALRHGVKSEDIMRANGMEDTKVRIGQKLSIPGSGLDKSAAADVDNTTTASLPKTAKPARRVAKATTIASRATEKVVAPKKSGAAKFRWPAKGRIISSFGEKHAGRRNDGIDISVPVGTPVKASENGTVIYAGSELEDFGNLVLVSHSGGWVTAYAHTSKTLVKRGDKVKRGQVIATSGNSGTTTVPKLHFEVRRNSKPVNPIKHLSRS